MLDDGTTLRSAIAADPAGYLGPAHAERFGSDLALLVKLLDTGERLLVHFHPPRPFAAAHLHSCHGKTEAWVVTQITADAADASTGHVYVGFREDTDPAVVRDWVDAQDKARAALLGAPLNKVPADGTGRLLPGPGGRARSRWAPSVTVVEVREPTDFSILLEWRRATRSTAWRPGTSAWATRSPWRRWTTAAGTAIGWPGLLGGRGEAGGPEDGAGPVGLAADTGRRVLPGRADPAAPRCPLTLAPHAGAPC